MKKMLSILALVLLICNVAMANQVELKGFKLGLTKKEFKKVWKSQRAKYHQSLASLLIPHYTTTLAGVTVDKPDVWYTNKKIDHEYCSGKIFKIEKHNKKYPN